MRVFVESNFVLELTLQQQEYESCAAILGLAKARRLELLIPSFSLFEPFTTLDRRRREREALGTQVKTLLGELRRTSSLTEEVERDSFGSLLVKSVDLATKSYRDVIRDLLAHAQVVPLVAQTFVTAADWSDQLTLPDSLVFASVFHALSEGPAQASCFITRNAKDFDDPLIKEVLSRHNCSLKTTFEAGRALIEQHLGSPVDSRA